MKIVKYIFFLIILLGLSAAVFIATQNGKYTITASRTIAAPKVVVFDFVNDFKNWDNLEILKGIDSTASYVYNDSIGKGGIMKWDSSNISGTITTLHAAIKDSLYQKVNNNGDHINLTWRFKDTLNTTNVTVTATGDLTFIEKATLFWTDEPYTDLRISLNKGLKNIDDYLVNELENFDIEVEGLVTKNGYFYLSQSITSSPQDVTEKAISIFGNLRQFANENNITITGAPFIIYTPSDSLPLKYEVAIPVKDEIFTAQDSEFTGGKLFPFNALKTTLRGNYNFLPRARNKAENYISANSLDANRTGKYVEEFTKTSAESRKPSSWVTSLYIPVGPQQLTEKDTLNQAPPAPPVIKTYRPKPKPRPVITPVITDNLLQQRPE